MTSISVVNRVIDSLYLRLGSSSVPSPSPWLLSRLQAWRDFKNNFDYSNPTEFIEQLPGLGTFRLLPHGHRPYEFIFSNDLIGEIRVWNPERWSRASTTGHFYLDFRSCYLQSQSLELPAVFSFISSLRDLFYDSPLPGQSLGVWSLVSRMDLAVDIAWFRDFDWSDMDCFVYRCRQRRAYVESSREAEILWQIHSRLSHPTCNKVGDSNISLDLSPIQREVLKRHLESTIDTAQTDFLCFSKAPETIYFGRFASDLYARLYAKYRTLDLQSKQYMRDIWASSGWDSSSPVWRIEFSLTGNFLRSAGPILESPDGEEEKIDYRHLSNALGSIPEIWAYLTRSWLRHCDSSSDSLCTRWRTSDFWRAAQSAFDDSVTPIVRKPSLPRPTDEQITAQAAGCIRTMAAILSPSDESFDGLDVAFEKLTEILYRADFKYQQVERRQRMGIDDFSDTAYSAQCRRWRMAAGVGS